MSIGRLALVFAVLATGCAQVREITGGERDTEGPEIVEAFPANGSTRFVGDRFVLRFNERIQIERSRAGLLVSPPMDPPPTMLVRGSREVEVRLNAPLLPATTYSFAIGEAVKDLTEGNRSAGLDYFFSTGDHLDSLVINGSVTDAFTGEPQDQVLVMLLEEGDTTGFTEGRPAFVTRTARDGRFQLARLPSRPFHLVALRDINANYRFDLPNEEVAFHQEALLPQGSTDSIPLPRSLRMFKEVSAMQSVREATVTADRAWRLVLARPAERVVVRDIARVGGALTWMPEWGAARDSVLLWPSDTTALAEGRYSIITEEGELDTLRYRTIKPMPFLLQANVSTLPGTDGVRLVITASRPIDLFNPALMRLRADSQDIAFVAERDSANVRRLVLRPEMRDGARATLTLLPKAIRDIYSGANDTLRFAVGLADPSALGTLRISITGDGLGRGPYLLELLDPQGLVVRREQHVAPGSAILWEELRPGNHTMRLIEDVNDNGRWDTGEWRARRQPERVWRHDAPINVRAAWDLGVEWRIPAE